MRLMKLGLCAVLISSMASAAPMGGAARSVIPGDIQQLITVDYRSLKNNSTALALKAQVLPPSLKEFEGSLRGVGINPDKDVDLLTFASYRKEKEGLKVVGIAQGSFSQKAFLKKMNHPID